MLTEQQLAFFDVFGFFVAHEAFSSDEMATIIEQFGAALDDDRQGTAFSGERRQGVLGFLEQREGLFPLLEDDRIFGSVEQILGPGFVWIGSDGNLYVGNTAWHPDNPTTYRRLKVAFYLDHVTKDSGCLRVIPGSHHPGYADLLRQHPPREDPAESPYGVAGSEIPAYPLESCPGDVVFFNQALFHSSYGGRAGRRMFTLNFGSKPTSESHYDNLRRTYEGNVATTERLGSTSRDRIYTDTFLRSESPRIQSMVAEIKTLGFR